MSKKNADSISIDPLNGPVKAEITIPGSKSITNRALLLGALSEKRVTIKNALIADDTEAMLSALNKLGIKTVKKGDEINVIGSIKDVKDKKYEIDADLSGTTIRFLLPLLCIVPGEKIIFGKNGLNLRPLKDLIEALKILGAEIEYLGKNGYPPVKIKSSKLTKSKTRIKGSTSSQYLSALLMIMPVIGGGQIDVAGKLVSKSYVNVTLSIMEDFGVKVGKDHYEVFKVPAGKYAKNIYNVEGDYSSASYFAAAAALTGSTITLKKINPDTLQGDAQFLKILEDMGNFVVRHNNMIVIKGRGVKSVKVDMKDCPDQIQTLAVLSAFARGKTEISGITTLAVKETNRLEAIKTELSKMGIGVKITGNCLIIYGGKPEHAVIDTHGDHRTAMSFAIAGVKIPGMIIKNPGVVNKTYPLFWQEIKKVTLSQKLK